MISYGEEMARAWEVPTHLQPAHTKDSLTETIVYNFWNVKHTEMLWGGPVYQGQKDWEEAG